MCVVQIGELAAQLSDEMKAKNHSVPWRIIKDTRNFYVHAYGNIDLETVWNTLNEDIPMLKNNVKIYFCNANKMHDYPKRVTSETLF